MAEPTAQAQAAAAPAAAEPASDFLAMLQGEVRARTDEKKTAVTRAIISLAEQALADTKLVSDNALKSIEAIIAELDRKLSEQVNLILHHDDFKTLEGAWRGLHHLVNNTETDTTLKIRVMNISKKDFGKALPEGVSWDQSALFKQIYEQEYGTLRGQPFGCLVGDYQFDNSPPDVKMLTGIAQIAAAAHCPFISAAAPGLLGMDTFEDLNKPRALDKVFERPDYAAWRSLREDENSRYLGLTMPRVLARLPYGAKTNPVEGFAFEEETESGDHNKYCWMNSAYAMAVNINRSFKLYGWCASIRGVESGGLVEGLPVHTFPSDDGGVDMKCPTEIAIPDRRENELATLGLMPLLHGKNTDYAAFIGAQSVHKPEKFDDKDSTANANLSARLPYMFATCRFAHYLKSMVRDKVGAFMEREDMERWLNQWIMNYVTADPKASPTVKAQYPLADAKVVVEDVEGNPGWYTSKVYLRPHYQLEGLTVSLRLVSKLKQVG